MQSEGVSGSPRIIGAVVAGFLGVANGSNFYVPRPSLFPLSPERSANASSVPLIAFLAEESIDSEADYSVLNVLAAAPSLVGNLRAPSLLDEGAEAIFKGSYLRDPDEE
nr:hypothetical protein NG677_20080 [Methylobacterium sp. OTU13CASTA1]